MNYMNINELSMWSAEKDLSPEGLTKKYIELQRKQIDANL